MAEPDGPPARRERAHRKLALTLIVVAGITAFLAIFALWANRQALDTDNWTETSSQLLEDEAIRTQVTAFLVDELYTNVDVEAELREALPPRAQPLAGPVAGGLRDLAERVTFEMLGRPRVQGLWEEANRRAHARLVQVVEEGGGETVSTEEGVVTLDLEALLIQLADRVGIGDRVQSLPADAAQVEILESDQLGFAQDLVDFLQVLAIVLVVLSIALIATAVWLARDWRREALRASGIALIVAGAANLVVRELGGDAVVGALTGTEAAEPAARATWDIGTRLLEEAAVATIIYGVFLVVGAWLAGPTGWAVSVRAALAPYLRAPRWAWGGFAVFVAILVLWAPTPAMRQPVTALILIGLLALGMEALRRLAAREHPGATIEASMERQRERLTRAGSAVRGGVRRAKPGDRAGGAPQTSVEERLVELERLGKLRAAGVLEPEEFEREKRRILGEEPVPSG